MSITFEQVDYTYQPNTPLEYHALKNINIKISDQSYTAIVGHTGSGKSTLIRSMNGLLKPTTGRVNVRGHVVTNKTKNKKLSQLRSEVGIVFQFPETQLFEETVLKDIAFGPKNIGKSEEEAMQVARQMAQLAGLPESTWNRSPFELSGGQMRRVAIAGVLAMEPKILVLDEPTAGLDPDGREDIMELFYRLYSQEGLTIVLVTHQMNDVAQYADNVIALDKGKVVFTGSPRDFFANSAWLEEHHLSLSQTADFVEDLKVKGLSLKTLPLTLEELADELMNQYRQRGEQLNE